MKRVRTLAIVESYPGVNRFLNSKSRNSNRTKVIYGYALEHFETFLKGEYKDYNIETILTAIQEKKVDVYQLLDDFVGYLTKRQDANNGNTGLSSKSIQVYIVGIRSYLEANDIEISSSKFKKRVTIPKTPKGIPEPIDASDIRTILQACNNERLKVFLLVLASSGMRSIEALTLRNSDIDFSSSPTKVHIRPENSKTNQENYVYISDEASKELKGYIDSKDNTKPDRLVFSYENGTDSKIYLDLYRAIHLFFTRTLKKIEMNKRRDGTKRRTINFHSFRAFVYTTATRTKGQDFANWLLGHSNSTYWREKEETKRKDYLEIMRYLTFLDYSVLDAAVKSTEAQLKQQEKQIQIERNQMQNMREEMNSFKAELAELKRKRK